MLSKKIIIIGGTSGIGFETSKYLLNKGYDVIIVGRRLVNQDNIASYSADVRNNNSVANLFNIVKRNHKSINGLVYSVGITTSKKNIQDFDENIWNDIVDTNVTGLLRVLKHFYPLLKDNSGKVVVVNSLASRKYSDFSGIEYTASKSALSGLVKQLAIEWIRDNVFINSVFPSMTLTPMLLQNVDAINLEKICKNLPIGKLADPVDTARAIEYLISSENHYITGSGIDISGGQYLNG